MGLVGRFVWATERNRYGAWVVYGALGVHQFYYMSKAEAVRRYVAECKEKIFINQPAKKGRKQ